MPKTPMNSALIIPAFQPSDTLPALISQVEGEFDRIVVVNDGTTDSRSRAIIHDLIPRDSVVILEHAINLGKGAALKTALNFVYLTLPHVTAIVCADADGQHEVEDIRKILTRASENPDKLILGCRSFVGYVPLRSRLGNVATRIVFRWITGVHLADTQTGLRGIPRPLVTKLLKIEANGYDFEIDMLLTAIQSETPLVEEPIRTVYEEGNRSSHFDPFFDSMKIYFLLLRFTASSLLGAAMDFSLFCVLFWFSGALGFSQATARAVTAPINFAINRKLVFKSHRNFLVGLVLYFLVVVANCTAAYLSIKWSSEHWGIPVPIAKASVEIALFFVSYSIQNEFIFRRRTR